MMIIFPNEIYNIIYQFCDIDTKIIFNKALRKKPNKIKYTIKNLNNILMFKKMLNVYDIKIIKYIGNMKYINLKLYLLEKRIQNCYKKTENLINYGIK